jgi:hypothetical protein
MPISLSALGKVVVMQMLGAGIASRYHLLHCPDLSLATNRMADRHG